MSAIPAAALLEALPLPAILIGGNDRIALMNDHAVRLLGRSLVGLHHITALRQPALLDAIEAARRDGMAREASFLGRDHAQETTWSVHVASAGDSLLATFEDRSSAEEADQSRRNFVANVSHELKTPLTSLLGFIETLRGSARDDPAAQARFLETMSREAQRMNRLVSDLLSLGRVEADERVRPRDRVEMLSLLRSVLHAMAPMAEKAGATITLDATEERVELPGDPDQLRQVFSNLVENAVKYAGGEIRVVVRPQEHTPQVRGPTLRIEVRDSGPGIDSYHLPRLSQRFYRVDTHRSREVGGTGLGLAIVKHIVGRHRGRLEIVSKPGQGSRFAVLLPTDIEEFGLS